jgi:NADPH-dependent 2,4-dienoyl-CoA reductase/sulfur reductase-like enzyme
VTRILVAGGGASGVAAAVSASGTGARVTLAEGSEVLLTDRAVLPRLLSSSPRRMDEGLTDPGELLARHGVEVRLGDPIISVDAGSRRARSRGGWLEFDGLVLATGSTPIAPELRGSSLRGVFSMRTIDDYLALSDALPQLPHVVLAGPLPVSLMLAEAISQRSRVSVFLGSAPLSESTRRSMQAVADAAAARGVRLLHDDIDGVVGVGRAEAVLASGGIVPCDGVVLVPRTSPSLPSVECRRGDRGGALVDESMRTSCGRIFASGECAEMRFGSGTLPARLRSSSLVMGEAAGVNACGGNARASVSRCIALDLFGVELCAAGIDAHGARRLGVDAAEFCGGEEHVGVSLTYERSTGVLLGVQVAGPGAVYLSEFASLVVSSGLTLEDLAYRESPCTQRFNRDRSPICLTAGRALARARA